MGQRQQTQGGDGLTLSQHLHTLPGTCDVRCSAGVAATDEGCKPASGLDRSTPQGCNAIVCSAAVRPPDVPAHVARASRAPAAPKLAGLGRSQA